MKPKKSLGQNFIHDENFLNKLNGEIKSGTKTNIIEIGPGKGALTKYLIKKKYRKIILIEKDNSLIKYLEEFNGNLDIICSGILLKYSSSVHNINFL